VTTLWQRITLGAILVLSVFLNFFHLGENHFGDITTAVNSYYAAAVQSMSVNWHNFFFAAFDPAGFLAIDKPPLGFWVQVISTRFFGFSAWSLLAPEALAGVGAVAMLYILVRRIFGPNAGLIAALALALTPISVLTSRNNTIDSMLVLVLLLAAWTLSLAAETGRLRWLLLSALLVGLGFNIKMLEAYLVLPAFALTYLLSAPRRWRVRWLHLFLAGVLLLIVSFSWMTLVDLVPPTQRPYVSSTQSDSELELALGYNGLGRAFGVGSSSTSEGELINPTTLLVLFGIANTGLPGPFRLFNPRLGGQISWLLLLAICGLVVAFKWWRPLTGPSPQQKGLLFWGIWLLTLLIFFSAAFFDHPYYMVTFAPAICALVGIGCVAMYQAFQKRTSWRGWFLPLALLLTLLVQGHTLLSYPVLNHLLAPFAVLLPLVIVVVLVIAYFVQGFPRVKLTRPLVIVCLALLLFAPTAWIVLPLQFGNDTIDPVAGPPPQSISSLALIAHEIIPESVHAQRELEDYLLANRDGARYLAATVNASTAAPFILDTAQPLIALGGYDGFDHILTVQQVASFVQQNQVRFFLLPLFTVQQVEKMLPPGTRQDLQHLSSQQGVVLQPNTPILQPAITQWVIGHCRLVPRATAEPGTTGSSNTIDLGEGTTFPTSLFACV
jgi:4-amino-4-deoxy-L-arabinose transferase-like glycosyltransferase